MTSSFERIPGYLRSYVVTQGSDSYTEEEHAAWRFIMRQARAFFLQNFVGDYDAGLKAAGITTERIPSVAAMDSALQEIGWGALPVRGFIPPGAFLDFQARKILPIAADMRTVANIAYTPAPDIVHEAAGHAPLLIDKDYSRYLTQYAAMAQKALFCQEDLDLYEAIRALSDLKENPDSSKDQIDAAEVALRQAVAAVPFVSEAQMVARMNWWTVEYGLAGDVDSPKIYGAGLMSSVGESRNCLTDAVKKIPLTVECIHTSYDITRPQPQLFVCKDTAHLVTVLEDLEKTLAYQRGGAYGIKEALRCRTVATAVLSNKLSISGQLTAAEFNSDDPEKVDFLKFDGPVQLACEAIELEGQGVGQHPHGFSSPLGTWRAFPGKDPCSLTAADLASKGIRPGAHCQLEFDNGFEVKGKLLAIETAEQILAVLKWTDCTIRRGDKTYYQPEWGTCDMLVADGAVPGVHGGAADRGLYGNHDLGQATTQPGRETPYTAAEKQRFELHGKIVGLRLLIERQKNPQACLQVAELWEKVEKSGADNWLLRFEAWELAAKAVDGEAVVQADVDAEEASLLRDSASLDPQIQTMLQDGISLVKAEL